MALAHRRPLLLAALAVLGLLAARSALCAPIAPGALRPPPPGLGDGADPERLRRHVRALSVTIGPRGVRHPEGLRRAAAYVASAFSEVGLEPELQPIGTGHPPFANVSARVGAPGDPLLVVGAHYDAFGDTAGADDDASGVAGLLELARLLARLPSPPPIELVAYALEEPPHFRTERMGSAVHARAAARRGSLPRAMIAVEMIGYFDDRPGSQSYPTARLSARMPSEGDFVAVIGRDDDRALALRVRDAMSVHAALRVFAHTAPATAMGIDFSDHRSYWGVGVPAVMVTDTAFLRNRAYHEGSDTADRLDYVRMARVVDGLFAACVDAPTLTGSTPGW